MNESDATIILDNITEGVFTVSNEWRITYFNRAAESLTGVPRKEALGKMCSEVLKANICEGQCVLRQTMETGTSVTCKEIFLVDKEGHRRPVSISTALLRSPDGAIIGGVETIRDLGEVSQLRKELHKSYTVHDIVTRSSRMRKVLNNLSDAAETDSTVLLCGESGTGKELAARAIHNLSPRKGGPFIAVNCASLPETLLESELFGHKRGAFTGAQRNKKGRFAQANGGTIFLDELGDVTPAVQVKLLRVLQERQYYPLGADHPEHTDARVVAATNRDLEEMLVTGEFRQDLYYRINVVKLTLPPLRDRRVDVPLLIDHLLERFNHLHKKDVRGTSPDFVQLLLDYDFPGNIRELENIVEHAFVMTPGPNLTVDDLPDAMRPSPPPPGLDLQGDNPLKSLEGRIIWQALEETHFNRSKAAARLGMHKATLYRKIHSLGLKLPTRDGRSQ